MLKFITLLLLLSTGGVNSYVQKKSFIENDFYGVWKWVQVENSETMAIVPVEEFTLGLAKYVSTEFIKDSVYLEVKNKLGSNVKTEPTKGKWYYDITKNTLNTNAMNKYIDSKWISSDVIYFSNDTLIISMMGPLQLKMIRQRK